MKRLPWFCLLSTALVAGCPADDDPSETGDSSSEASSAADDSSGPGGSSDPSDTNVTSATSDTSDDSSALLGCAAEIDEDTTDGAADEIQTTWGAPCTEDSECEALLGDGGVCLFEAVIFELPLGYCSKTCTLPSGSMYSIDDPQCDPDGGVDCIGQAPLFMVCAPQCTDDTQCNRDGYTCRNFPLIASEGDPTYCLMPDCCEGSCAEE